MTKSPKFKENFDKLAKRNGSEALELEKIEKYAVANFKGQFSDLAAALGMLRLGDHVGWKVLALIHNKRTVRKYEEILDISIREQFPEEGPSANRSMGYAYAKKIGKYWKAVSGDEKVESRKEIE